MKKPPAIKELLERNLAEVERLELHELEEAVERKIARDEAHYWDTFDAEGNVIRLGK